MISKSIIDDSTNGRFSGIEDALARELRFFIVSLDARSHREPNKHPPSLQVASVDGEKLVIDAGRGVRSVPRLEVDIVGRQVTISGVIKDEADVQLALERRAKKADIDIDIEKAMAHVRPLIRSQLKPVPEIQAGASLWGDESYRVASKIAFNLLGFCDSRLALRAEFDPIRQFVLHGIQPVVPPVEVVPLDLRRMETSPLGPLDHLVMVRGDSRLGRVVGFVTYFGVLSFSVRLAECELERDFSYSYRVDQLGAVDRLNGAPEAQLEVPDFELCSKREYAQCADLAVDQMKSLLYEVNRFQVRHWIGTVVERHWKAALAGEAERELSEEEYAQFLGALSNELAVGLTPLAQKASRRETEQPETAPSGQVDGSEG
ncbi:MULTISPECIES: hypothetical protein [Corallococcus]|uniref:hypothetical protein n=1 Tax=Corallococcus TaxID=83461 RepID=UPI0011C3FAAE|nr:MULTISPECIES: hypothetical protein [Corallococcus]